MLITKQYAPMGAGLLGGRRNSMWLLGKKIKLRSKINAANNPWSDTAGGSPTRKSNARRPRPCNRYKQP
ncbi:MAG: hypothetical protein IPG29_13045 [Sphingobacteriales bacterium]|nr:hypothetical protein [Sphingobacteriales bacterium]